MAGKAFLHPDFRPPARVDFCRRPVARFARDAYPRMEPVRKEDVRRQLAFECERPFRRVWKHLRQSFDFRRFRKRQVVTIHAVGPRRHRCPDSEIRSRVALRAVQAQIFPVQRMAKGNFGLRVAKIRKGTQVPGDKKHAAPEKREQAKPVLDVFSFQDATTLFGMGPIRQKRSISKKNNFLQNQIPSFLYFAR